LQITEIQYICVVKIKKYCKAKVQNLFHSWT